MTGCFHCHKLMAVDRSSRKSLHSIEISRTINNKPHKFVEGIFFFFFFSGLFVCLVVCFYCLFGIYFFAYWYLILLGDGISLSAEQSTSINLLPASIGPDIVVY